MIIKTNCATTGIGSLPHKNPLEAVDFVLKTCPEVPYWPQLPQRSDKESMIYQFAYGLPGFDAQSGTFKTEDPELGGKIEKFYEEMLTNPVGIGSISSDCASGLSAFAENQSLFEGVKAVKGHVTGPVSMGLSLVDEAGKFIIYNDLIRDVYVDYLSVKAKYMELELKKISDNVIIFFDEPLLYSYGSAYFNLPRDVILEMLKKVMSGLDCTTGMHACHNCDWSILYDVNPNVISFDAYSYLDKFLIYKQQLKQFIENDGIVAWGIVPTTDEKYLSESAESLMKIMDEMFAGLEADGFDIKKILQQSLITPADGVGTLSMEHAQHVFKLNSALSDYLKEKI